MATAQTAASAGGTSTTSDPGILTGLLHAASTTSRGIGTSVGTGFDARAAASSTGSSLLDRVLGGSTGISETRDTVREGIHVAGYFGIALILLMVVAILALLAYFASPIIAALK